MNGINISTPKMYVFSIAIEKYAFLPKLPNAVNDSNAIIKALFDKYKVDDVWRLENDYVTPNAIKDSFSKIKAILKPEDSLLIIYNGHGTIRGKGEIAYWQIHDSKERDENTWYKCSDFFDEMTELDVSNIALFVNSCFSGNLFHQDGFNTSKYDEGEGKKTRALFTAGLRNEATVDKYDSNKNSPFASAFIEVLSNNKDQHELYLLNIVSYIYSQFNKNEYGSMPRYGTFKGDDGGQFVLYLREDIEEGWNRVLKENTVEVIDDFIQKFGESKYLKDAENRKNFLMQERQNWINTLDKVTELIKPFAQETSNKKVAEQAFKFYNAIKTKRDELSKGVVVNHDWQKLMELNNSNVANSKKIDELKKFIANNNSSDYMPLAEKILENLEDKVKEEELWSEINNRRGKSLIHIKRGFIQYIHEHTYGRYIYEANQNLRDISLWIEIDEQIRNKQDLDEGRKKLYEYKAKFPQGLYVRQAEKELSKISIEAQAIKIKREFEEAKESNNLNKVLELIEDIENFSDENEIAANRDVFDEAKAIIEAYENKKSEAYKKVIESKRVLDLKHFLKLYSDDNLASEEVENVSLLLYEKEQTMYYEAEAEKTIDSFVAYTDEFDNGDNFYDKAKERIKELELYFSLKNKKEFQDYIKEYAGKGLMLAEANEKIAAIEYEEHKQKKFEDTMSMNSVDLYIEYLDFYENDKDERWYEVESSFQKLELELKADNHFQEINKTLDEKNKLSLCISYLSKYEEDEKHFEEVQSIKKEVEEIIESRNALDNAINKSDIKLFEEYKQKYSYNIELADDYIDYLSAKTKKTKEAFLGYLEKYNENGANIPKAIDAIRYLEALSSKEIKQLYEYVSNSIEKEFYYEAQERIRELEEIKEIENEFKVANEKNSIESYSRFIRLYGEKDKKKRDLIIEKLSDLKRRKQDNEDFQAAKDSGEAQPLAKYIGKYGESGLNIIEATDLFRKRKLGVTEREISVSNKVDEISILAKELRKATQRNFYVIIFISFLFLLSIIFILFYLLQGEM